LVQISAKFVRKVVLMISSSRLNMGHLRIKNWVTQPKYGWMADGPSLSLEYMHTYIQVVTTSFTTYRIFKEVLFLLVFFRSRSAMSKNRFLEFYRCNLILLTDVFYIWLEHKIEKSSSFEWI
jgi:hypothetical protein